MREQIYLDLLLSSIGDKMLEILLMIAIFLVLFYSTLVVSKVTCFFHSYGNKISETDHMYYDLKTKSLGMMTSDHYMCERCSKIKSKVKAHTSNEAQNVQVQ